MKVSNYEISALILQKIIAEKLRAITAWHDACASGTWAGFKK